MLNYAISRSSQVNIRAYLPSSVSLFDLIVPTFCAYGEMKPGKNTCPYSNLLSNIRTSVAGVVVVVPDPE